MRFLVDTQLPRALVRYLQSEGQQAEHVLDLGLAQSKDNTLWEFANKNQAIIVTKDEDFADWIARGRPGPIGCMVESGKLYEHCFGNSLYNPLAANL